MCFWCLFCDGGFFEENNATKAADSRAQNRGESADCCGNAPCPTTRVFVLFPPFLLPSFWIGWRRMGKSSNSTVHFGSVLSLVTVSHFFFFLVQQPTQIDHLQASPTCVCLCVFIRVSCVRVCWSLVCTLLAKGGRRKGPRKREERGEGKCAASRPVLRACASCYGGGAEEGVCERGSGRDAHSGVVREHARNRVAEAREVGPRVPRLSPSRGPCRVHDPCQCPRNFLHSSWHS